MKLYEIRLPAVIYCKCYDGSEHITVDHLDGAYSYCVTQRGAIVHLASFTELEKHADGYRITDEKPVVPPDAMVIRQ